MERLPSSNVRQLREVGEMKRLNEQIRRIVQDSQLAHYSGNNREWIEDLIDALISLLVHEAEPLGKMFPVSECCRAGAAKVEGTEKPGKYYVCSNCGMPCNLTDWSKPKQLPGLPSKLKHNPTTLSENVEFVDKFTPGNLVKALCIIQDHEKKIDEIIEYLKARE